MKNLSLTRAVELLQNGEVVAFPTETVYGLGADARNPSAVQKVFDIKGRPADNPLIVHISSPEMVGQFARNVPGDAAVLMERFWPGPLTLIFQKKEDVLDIITGGLHTVALRWPGHPISQQLIAMAGPLVAPSANSSGRPSPTKPEHVREDFGEDFPVIEAGETEIGLESTVLDITRKPYRIYRPGAVSAGEIETVTDRKVETDEGPPADASAKSPGTKYSHYAPDAVVSWLEREEKPGDSNTLYLLHKREPETGAGNIIFYNRDYRRMARDLYDRFRQADHKGYRSVRIEPFTGNDRQKPLAEALENRITKAIE